MNDKAQDATSRPLILARNLTRKYSLGSAEVIGVDQIDLEIDAAELLVLKGYSGSGKSTLLSLLAGLDRPSGGSLRVAGTDLMHTTDSRLTRFRREVVGMVFQAFNLLPTLRVMENVCLPALLAGKPLNWAMSRAEDLLDWLNMGHRAEHLPSQLSGGEMQRTAIARALINEPSIILADEPTGNLDSRNGQAVMRLLADLNRKWQRTVIIATHSDLADPFATMKVRLKDGRILNRS